MSGIHQVTGSEVQNILANRQSWKAVDMQAYRYTSAEQESSPLAGQAQKRVAQLLSGTDFIGMGGLRINDDGSYDVVVDTGSEKADAKLKDILEKTFAEDEELSSIMEKIRNLGRSDKAEKVVKDENGKDTFVRAEDQDGAAKKWFDAIRAGKTSRFPYEFYSPAKSAFANEAAIRRVEDWIDNGGDYPDIHRNHM